MRRRSWGGLWVGTRGRLPRKARALRPSCEPLEGRALLTTPGYDYVLSGLQWSNPGRITYSIAPDGVFWDHGVNNLNATFNAKFGPVWTREIGRALATWESVANINIVPVPELGSWDFDVAGLPQGDIRFGDIRFGGYDFGSNTTLAQSYSPPPTGATGAGDVEVNTAMPFHIGSDYDFYSVMLHETGLALGLNEPPSPSVVMNTMYGGVRPGLTAGDIAGIQAIYGARTPDGYQGAGMGVSLATAVDVTSLLNASHTATLNNLSLWTFGDTEYFSVVAPAGSGDTLQVTAAAGGISLLSPKVSLLDTSGHLLAAAGNSVAFDDNVTVTFSHVVPGQRYYLAVTGATGDVFSVGAYHLQVSFPHATPLPPPPTPPPSPPPYTYTPPPNPVPTPRPTPTPVVPRHPVKPPPRHRAPVVTWHSWLALVAQRQKLRLPVAHRRHR